MSNRDITPGISRQTRISDEGLARLERHLAGGALISDVVLAQWIERYGDAARLLLKQYGVYHAGLR